MKKEEIVNLNRTLLYVSFGNMSKTGKSAMMRNLVRLGKHSKEIEDAMKIAFDKFKPAGLDDLMKNKDRSEEEQKELNELTNKFDTDIKDYSSELLSEEVEIEIHYISDADFDDLVDATSKTRSDLTAGNFMYLREYLVKE
ncbi:hypothetical protein H8788_16730 [Parabacteroides faecis]|jgi:hypothetical protein|uniref:hypothetical protein n=1 Tax=Parabacteroides faecis TaxID=1217282 RepID=UPI001655D33B|nr:hypothetical protein [Parabacteroides faecis]MBC8619388.1 hypothetical protein [Parabacteroides faecis]